MRIRKFLIVLSLTLGLLFFTTGTVAYYRYAVDGSIVATSANYTFNVSSGSTSTKEINLGDSLKPFDKGSFNLTVNLNNTDSDAYFSVKIERTNLPKGFKFLAQDDNISPFSTYSKSFKSTDTKSDTVTVYWYWDGNVNDENDTGFVGKSLSADIVIDSKQMNGAYMKNGYSAKSEFWSDTYRPYIRTVSFVKNISNVPSTCDEANLCWDVTESETKKVYAYLVDSGLKDSTDNTKTLYNLYIASEVEIYAPDNCYGIFRDFTNLKTIDFSNNFNTSNVINMSYMFSLCSSLINLDLSNFSTQNVTTMEQMFYGCTSLTNLNLCSFNTLNVENMKEMFMNLNAIENLDITNFNTSKITDMTHLFAECTSLKTLDLSSFNTSKVTLMFGTFSGCASLEDLNLKNFNTSSLLFMGYMLFNCSSLVNLDLSNFDTSNVTNMNYMFYGCANLKDLNLGVFDTSSATNTYCMFYNCSNLLTEITIKNASTSRYTGMFSGCSTASGAKVTVNYTSSTSSIVDSMIATKSSNSNIIKGTQI